MPERRSNTQPRSAEQAHREGTIPRATRRELADWVVELRRDLEASLAREDALREENEQLGNGLRTIIRHSATPRVIREIARAASRPAATEEEK